MTEQVNIQSMVQDAENTIDIEDFRGAVAQAIDDYAELVAAASTAVSVSELDAAAQQFPIAPLVHKMISFLLKLERKGLCEVKLSDFLREQVTAKPMAFFNPAKPEVLTPKWIQDMMVSQVAAYTILEAEMFVDAQTLMNVDLDLVPDFTGRETIH